MRKFLCSLLLILPALVLPGFPTPQTTPDMNYEREWKTIDSLEQEGLLRSALEQTEQLFDRARADGNDPHAAKATLYRAKYTARLEEDGMVRAIELVRDIAAETSFPLRPVLQSILGELYVNYAESSYGQLMDRTPVPGELPEDILTWSMDQLAAESSRLYLASLADEKLQNIALGDWSVITTKAQNTADLRPTLYDLLAHRALDHFSNERLYLTAPAYRFYIDQAEAFAPATDFVEVSFATRDTASFKRRALNIYQDILRFHLEDEDPAALVDADLKRLQFAYDQSVNDLKDSLYLDALQKLERRYEGHPASAEVLYYLARYHYDQGQRYQPNPEDWLRWEYKKAKAYCDEAVRRFPDSYGAAYCKGLLVSITETNLNLQLEMVNLPGASLLARLEYRNLGRAHLRIISLTEEERDALNQQRSAEVIKNLTARKPLRRWSVKLPLTADFQTHATEIRIDRLPLGNYAVLISSEPEFKGEDARTGYLFTQVSQLGYFYRRNDEGDERFLVVDRESGQPLEGVLAEFFTVEYTNRSDRQLRKIGQDYTGADGMVAPPVQERSSYQVRFSKGRDVLSMGEGYYSYSRRYQRGEGHETHFFLDRAIYRPGQTVYFKGLLLTKDQDGVPRIAPDQEVIVTFYNFNNQEVDKATFRSNRYGTFNGSFKAPLGGLRGSMRLVSDFGNSTAPFRVEEYKRPKFEVVMDTLSGAPQLGETVAVSGQAKAFAGSNVDGAEVRYRVVREVRFPWLPWWRMGRFFPFSSESMEIANGRLTTDAQGKFTIHFEALPDRSIPKDQKPEFVFTVYVDVTDISGEVQSTEKVIRLSYLGLKVTVDVPETIDRTRPLTLGLKTTNLDGKATPATGSVRIHRLKDPEQLFLDRYWEKPDQYVISEREFRRYFPHLAYRNEDEPEQWAKVEKHYDQDFDTGISEKIDLDISGWPVGHYQLVIKTKDDQGNIIEESRYLKVFDSQKGQLPAGILAWLNMDRRKAEPGEKANLYLGTAADGLHVLLERERRGELQATEWLKTDKWRTANYEVQEQDRGNVIFHFSYVRHNRAFVRQQILQVPWSQKDLQIEYLTFRDKLRPGAEEEWRIRISGPQKEAVAAEMVAAMYDASLDQFAPNQWTFSPYPFQNSSRLSWSPRHFSGNYLRRYDPGYRTPVDLPRRVYPELNWFDFYGYSYGLRGMEKRMMMEPMAAEGAVETRAFDEATPDQQPAAKVQGPPPPPMPEVAEEPPPVTPPPPVRTNLKETVFFFPELMTDAEGNVVLKFTMNEALTRWKLLGFAHTMDLKYGLTEKEVITQKELMVLPNPPRFLREGDRIEFTAKVSNLTERILAGKAQLELFDALTMEPVDALLANDRPEISFKAGAGQSDRLAWELSVPKGEVTLLAYRVTVQSGSYSDGEQNSLPVLTNRMLVTETKPLFIRGGKSETLTFEAMEKLESSTTLDPHQFTLEFTSNPAWYAVKALPYLMEYPHECIEQIFNRYYANSLASNIANQQPRIREVFERWKGTDALESPLALNEDLKAVLLEETPWVVQAQSEAEQRQRIGLLFDLQRMSEEKTVALSQIAERQSGNGGFSWFPGGRESWYMTQYIVEGLGHLHALGVDEFSQNTTARRIAVQAVRFIDGEALAHYEELLARQKEGTLKMEDDHLSNLLIHYLYARTFFPDYPMEGRGLEAFTYYLGQAEKYGLQKGIYEQGLIALALYRNKREESARRILRSLDERALRSEELGMYWKYDRGFFWHQLPIETHALMIELFAEVGDDAATVEELKLWLLRNKQTTHWKTTKATAAAVYALLRYGADWIACEEPVEIRFAKMNRKENEERIAAAQGDAEPGTGYFRTSWTGKEISAEMAKIKLKNPNPTLAWGALYWQYFEDLDKITTFEETPLTLQKQLFREESSDTGPVLKAVGEEMNLQPGDKLKVRIELRVDRDMEYVHLKDMRASGLEPVNVLSTYKWQGGLGYYESTGDAATHFFIDYLARGTYVFEYPLVVTHKGDFSNGISSIQCMYAPEFSSHSAGIRLKIED